MSDTESFESVMDTLLNGFTHDVRTDELSGSYKMIAAKLDRLKAAHDREIRDTAQQEYSRGYHDGQHSMDAEHRSIAMRLRQLPLDGGSHENLSQIARAIYHADFGWTQGACASLRDKLIDLMGGVSEPTINLGELSTALNHGNAEKPSITEDDDDAKPMTTDEFIEYINQDTRRLRGDAMKAGDGDDTCDCAGGGACAADCGGDSGKHEEVSDGRCEFLRDGTTSDSLIPVWHRAGKDGILNDGRVADDCGGDTGGSYRGVSIHLDGLDEERRKVVAELRKMRSCKEDHFEPELFFDGLYDALGCRAETGGDSGDQMCDRLIHLLGGDQPSGIDVLRAMDEREAEGRITDELREFVGTFTKRLSISVAEVLAIADRIDEQFDRICQQQEAVLQETIDKMVEECDELQAKLDKANGENKGLRLSIDEQKESIAQRKKTIGKLSRDNEKVWKKVHKLQAKLDEYDRTHVELPRDANGEVFRVGCEVKPVKRETELAYTVSDIELTKDGWRVCIRSDQYRVKYKPSFFEVFEPKPDTAESIVRDLSMGLITESLAIERIGKLNG